MGIFVNVMLFRLALWSQSETQKQGKTKYQSKFSDSFHRHAPLFSVVKSFICANTPLTVNAAYVSSKDASVSCKLVRKIL